MQDRASRTMRPRVDEACSAGAAVIAFYERADAVALHVPRHDDVLHLLARDREFSAALGPWCRLLRKAGAIGHARTMNRMNKTPDFDPG